jgi:hypothetical protein
MRRINDAMNKYSATRLLLKWANPTGFPGGWRGGDNQVHYLHTLENFCKEPGLVGIIFCNAQNKISNPSDLSAAFLANFPKNVHFPT